MAHCTVAYYKACVQLLHLNHEPEPEMGIGRPKASHNGILVNIFSYACVNVDYIKLKHHAISLPLDPFLHLCLYFMAFTCKLVHFCNSCSLYLDGTQVSHGMTEGIDCHCRHAQSGGFCSSICSCIPECISKCASRHTRPSSFQGGHQKWREAVAPALPLLSAPGSDLPA